MKISVLACESLGVRSLCCSVSTKKHHIIIDPGIALDRQRFQLSPHPFQIARCHQLKHQILTELKQADFVIVSHYHGDHCPILDALPYQLSFKEISSELQDELSSQTWFGKDELNLNDHMQNRKHNLELFLKNRFIIPKSKKDTYISFSSSVPHGTHPSSVMMCRIQDENVTFVYGSDIHFFHPATIEQIVDWEPDVLLSSGPPIYLPMIKKKMIDTATKNIIALSQSIPMMILDHHLCRSIKGIQLIRKLDQKTRNRICTGADFMKKTPLYLEAKRKELYADMPVPQNWMKKYFNYNFSFSGYLKWKNVVIREKNL